MEALKCKFIEDLVVVLTKGVPIVFVLLNIRIRVFQYSYFTV